MDEIEKLAEFANKNDINPVRLEELAQTLKDRYLDEKNNTTVKINKQYVGRCYKVSYNDNVEYIKVVSNISDMDGWVTGLAFMDNIGVEIEYNTPTRVWFSFSDDIYIDSYSPSSFNRNNVVEISADEYAHKMHDYVDKLLAIKWRINNE